MSRIPSSASPDVQQSFREMWAEVERVTGPGNINLSGRRVTNAGRAIDPSDYVTKGELKALGAGGTAIDAQGTSTPFAPAATDRPLVGTHAERSATSPLHLPEGTSFYETDRTVLYMVVAGAWRYVAGTMRTAVGDIPLQGQTGPPLPDPPPGTPKTPSPATGSIDVSTTPTLSWTIAPAATNYDVYFGSASPPPLVSAAQVGLTYTPGTLSAGILYSWQIIAHAPSGPTTGPLWSFRVSAGTAPTPPSPPTGTGAIYRDNMSLRYVSDNSHYFGIGVTAFTLLKDWLDGGAGAVNTFLDWMVANGIDFARALGSYWAPDAFWPDTDPLHGYIGRFDPQTYGGYYTGIGTLVDHMATKNLRLKLSLMADMQNGPLTTIVQTTHFNAAAAAMAGKGRAWLDGGNEYPQNGFDPSALTWPANLLAGRGSTIGEGTPPINPFDQFEFHPGRSDEWPRKGRQVYDVQTGDTVEGISLARPGGCDEPIGIGEINEPGRTTNNPDDVFDFVANPFGSYIVLHNRSSLKSLTVPSTIAQACITAGVYASTLVPARFRAGDVDFTHDGFSNFVLQQSPQRNGNPIWWLRANARIIGNEAWCTIVRPNYSEGLVVAGNNGWTVQAQYGARQNVVYLTR